MADKVNSVLLKRFYCALLALAFLWVTASAGKLAFGQAPRQSAPQKVETAKPSAPPTTEKVKEEEEGDNQGEERGNPVLSGTTDTNSEIDRGLGRKRTRPERPKYFTAQYAERYEDNVTLTDRDRRSDIIAVPQIGAGITHTTRHSQTQLDYLGSMQWHRRVSELNGMTHNFTIVHDHEISRRTTISISNTFSNRSNLSQPGPLSLRGALQPQTALTGTPANGAINVLVPSGSTFNQAIVGVTRQMSKHASLRANYSYALTRFEDESLIGNDEHALELGYGWQVSRTRGYELTYRFSALSGDGDVLTHAVLPSLWYQRNRLRLRLGAGPQMAAGKLFWTAVAETVFRPQRHTALSLNYNSGIGTGGGLAAASRNHTLFGSVSHARRRFEAELRVGYSRAQVGVLGDSSRAQNARFTNSELFLQTQLTYVLADRFGLFFDYSHARQSSVGDLSRKVNRNIFSVGINFDTRRTARDPQPRSVRR